AVQGSDPGVLPGAEGGALGMTNDKNLAATAVIDVALAVENPERGPDVAAYFQAPSSRELLP
ncbi:MAG: hypothetical protein U1C73_15900, partial [Dietzia sp.]|nr:hypothetical protein [Dietzia sp.]